MQGTPGWTAPPRTSFTGPTGSLTHTCSERTASQPTRGRWSSRTPTATSSSRTCASLPKVCASGICPTVKMYLNSINIYCAKPEARPLSSSSSSQIWLQPHFLPLTARNAGQHPAPSDELPRCSLPRFWRGGRLAAPQRPLLQGLLAGHRDAALLERRPQEMPEPRRRAALSSGRSRTQFHSVQG